MFGIRGNAIPITNIRNFNLIDYVKILLTKINVTRLLKLLEFKTEVSEKTGELSSKKVAKYKFCKITIYNTDTVLFTGSIHKFWNELNGVKAPNYKKTTPYKGFNGNLFSLNDILEVRHHLEKLFDCKPNQMIFKNLEIGVNTTPVFKPNQFIKGLLYHNNILFENKHQRNFAKAPHQRYILKIYNKSDQYEIDHPVLRIELKIIKSEELKKLGIKTFENIDSITLDKAKDLLLMKFDEVMHYDYTIKKKKLTKQQKLSLQNYSNPNYWINELEPRHRDRPKKRLKKIIINNSNNLQQQIRKNILEKCVIINRLPDHRECVIINSSNIELINTQIKTTSNQIFCPITGLPLSHENKDAKYIKTTTLNYLHDNNQEKFIELCSLLLNNYNGNRPKHENNLISHLAKQIRNRYYSQTKYRKTGYNQKKYSNQIGLFN